MAVARNSNEAEIDLRSSNQSSGNPLSTSIGKSDIRLLLNKQPLPEPAGSSLATFLVVLHRSDPTNDKLVEALTTCRDTCIDRDDVAPILDWYLVVNAGLQSNSDCFNLPSWIPGPLEESMTVLRDLHSNDSTPRTVLDDTRRWERATDRIVSALELSDTGTNKFGGEFAAWEKIQAPFQSWLDELTRGSRSELPKVDHRKIMKESVKPGSDRWRHMERRVNALVAAAVELRDATESLPAHGKLPKLERVGISVGDFPGHASALLTCCVEPLLDEASIGSLIADLEQESAWLIDDLSYSLPSKDRVWLALLTHSSGISSRELPAEWEKIDEINSRSSKLSEAGCDVTEIMYHLFVDYDVKAALQSIDEAELSLEESRQSARLKRQFEELRGRVENEAPDDEAFQETIQDIEADLSDSTYGEAEDRIAQLRQELEHRQRASRIRDMQELLERVERIDGAPILTADLKDALDSVENRGESATQELVDTFSDRVEQAEAKYKLDLRAELTDARDRLDQVRDNLSPAEKQSLYDTLSTADHHLQVGNLPKAAQAISSARSEIDRRHMPDWDHSMGEATLVNHIERFMDKRGHFDSLDIQRLHVSLKTRHFVILAGLTGSGKSTIARGYAEALGATGERVTRVAVRPNWVDESEALGYVNPTTRVFEPGWLATLIKGCWLDPELPHFLILDEMNLAPVEYYLADVLSAIEDVSAPGSRPNLQLYPKDATVTNAKDWPARLDYPRNLFIVGTVNIDESTRSISDRVLDRANVIQLSLDIDSSHHRDSGALAAEPPWRVRMSAWDRLVNTKPDDSGHALLVDIGKTLASIRIGIGIRSHIEIERFVANAKGVMDATTALDLAVLQRIIPKIRGFRVEIRDALDEIRKMVDEAGLERCKTVLDYWLSEETPDSVFIDGTDAAVGLANR